MAAHNSSLAPSQDEQNQNSERPKPPFPQQKLNKPGLEKDLDPQPQFYGTQYKAAGKLQGKTALITGGDSGIGRSVAIFFAREGADVAINYLPAEQADADETKRYVEAAGQTCIQLPGDLREVHFCGQLVQATVKQLGNAVAPGPVWTPLNPADRGESAEEVAHFGEKTPLGRPAQPEEIAPAYVFFASNADSSYITGHVLPLLGGETGSG